MRNVKNLDTGLVFEFRSRNMLKTRPREAAVASEIKETLWIWDQALFFFQHPKLQNKPHHVRFRNWRWHPIDRASLSISIARK
jgi:hypothetical protein